MANYYYTATELLASIKRRIMMPASQATLTDQELLDFATEEINMVMVPTIQNEQEDYFLVTEDIPLVLGKTKYPIPYRATGNKIRDVSHARSPSVTDIYELTRISIGDLPFYNQPTGGLSAFYVANNDICLSVGSNSNLTGSLRISYYLRPNVMVPVDEVCIVENIDFTLGEIRVNALPEKMLDPVSGALIPDQLMDFIMLKSPHKTLAWDIPIVSWDPNTRLLTFDPADIPEDLVVKDHIALATETAIPQIPSDMHVFLAQSVATRCLEAIGDTEGLQNANQKLAIMQQAAKDLINNRVEEAPKKIVGKNSVLRNGLSRRSSRRW